MIVELSENQDYKHLTALEQRIWEHASERTNKPLKRNIVNYRLLAMLSIPLFFSGICFGIGITLALLK